MLSGALKRFVMDNSHASIDTKKATQRTVELFLKAFGDAPASIVGGAKAGAFRDLLFALPASLGKRKSSLTLEEEAQRAREEGLPTLSGKNHMMHLSALWNQLHQREQVTRNPWTGWNFENGQKTCRALTASPASLYAPIPKPAEYRKQKPAPHPATPCAPRSHYG
ncbi:hypothetical protein [Acetobacter oryzoeni]|uniref:hypothetical protein n=1 Tax=Acetobacter oryzoeni TaxID=2500548 RepID=UPI001FCB6E60|nr:hypothetical protein [Acetobacter oryzoeni]MCP1203291.1 hypothetical protein [Acetobacter oryzoeni]